MSRKSNKSKTNDRTAKSWGIGIEHEMLYEFDGKPGLLGSATANNKSSNRNIVDSVRIVEMMNLPKIRRAFDAIDGILDIKLPRLYERAAGPFTMVCMTDDVLRDPYIGILNKLYSEEELIRKLADRLSPSDTFALIVTIGPYLNRCMDSLFYPLLDATDRSTDMFEIMNREFMHQLPEITSLFVSLYIDPEQTAHTRILSKILAGSKDLVAFVEHLFTTLEKLMSPRLAADSRVGAYVYGRLRVRYPSISISYTKMPIRLAKAAMSSASKKKQQQQQQQQQELTLSYKFAKGNSSNHRKRLLIAAAIRLIQLQVDLDLVGTVDFDKPFVEIKTQNHANATVDRVVGELLKLEADLKNKVMSTFEVHGAKSLPYSCYTNLLYLDPFENINAEEYPDSPNLSSTPEKFYGGSFHFWMTLPHDKNALFYGSFAHDHARFAHCLQWIEPLLLSLSGGDPSAIGAGTDHPRAAYRMTVNRVGGVGTTNTCRLFRAADGVLPVDYPLVYFADDASFERAFENYPATAGAVEMFVLPPTGKRVNVTIELDDGSVHSLKGCEDVEREARAGALIGRSVDHPLPESISSLMTPMMSSSRTPHNQMLRTSYGTKFAIKDGSDVRIVSWCDAIKLRLRPYWHAYPVMTPGGDIVLRFFNPTSKRIRMTAPLKDELMLDNSVDRLLNVPGFEFRLMDNMPLSNVEPLMHLFVLVAAASHRNAFRTCEHVQYDTHWSTIVARVVVRGKYAVPDDAYIDSVGRILGVDLSCARGKDVFQCLTILANKLYSSYRSHEYVALMAPKLHKSKSDTFFPLFSDCNYDAWAESFEDMIRKRSDIDAIVLSIIERFCGVVIAAAAAPAEADPPGGDGSTSSGKKKKAAAPKTKKKSDCGDVDENASQRMQTVLTDEDIYYHFGKGFEYDFPYIREYIRRECLLKRRKEIDRKKVDEYFESTMRQRGF